ncbi:phage shock protein PspA [Colwellia psychrerythraea]|uniref:Phage shock protein A n=1 Tax=Colwellia psychrerythraea (strain 34H / ATCC BAA-681) TaxID=167879 RepID=Q47UX7_COLP3|nr:phage shock protein PspA [Colwellia psychrerythraea]AAZ25307.1 phage shock protein A [Colwellia psychrerythraea 34H]
MGLFSRFTDIVNANLNSMLDKAEHPEKMIRMIIGEMEETLVEVRSTAAKNIAEQKTLARKVKTTQEGVAHWHDKAEIALNKGREDLAKSALAQKHKCQAELTQLNEENVQLTDLLSAIQEDAQRLQDKLSEAKRRQDALRLRQESAEVRLKVREKAVIHNIDEAMAKFERYQQKIDHLEAQVESYDLTENKDLSTQISDLEQDDNIEAELAEMKKKVVNG